MRPEATSGAQPRDVTRLSDAHHDYACSRCRTRGGPCLEALWMARRVARGLAVRARDLPGDFELTSRTLFRGCGRDCAVLLRVRGTRLDIACGLPPGSGDPRAASARVIASARSPALAEVG